MATADLFVGQRVKFVDDELFDPRVGDGLESRGRILYLNLPLAQVLVDGKSFARWLHVEQLMAEGDVWPARPRVVKWPRFPG
jgi:hypothetical protein